MKRFMMLLLTIATVISLTVVPASASVSASASLARNTVKPGNTSTILHLSNGLVASVRHLTSTSPGLPRLPRGVHYAPEVTAVTVRGALPVTRALRPQSAGSPDTASGCTPYFGSRTCIYIVGSGLDVTYWTTSVTVNSGTRYPIAYYEVNGVVEEYDSLVTDGGSGLFQDPLGWENTYLYYSQGHPVPYTFRSNVKACNFWTGAVVNTLPCESIHS